MAEKKKGSSLTTAQKVGLGASITAAAVTAAGAFFLYGSKDAQKNRKKVKSWMLKAKGEVLEALENAKEISEDEYRAIVEAAGGAYGSAKKATRGELKEFKDEMSDHWKKLQRTGVLTKIVGKAPAKKAVPVKKSAPKAAPKTETKKETVAKKTPAKKTSAKKAA